MQKQIEGADQLHGYSAAEQCFCFHYIVSTLYFLNLKFQASNNPLCLYSPVSVGPSQIFSRSGSNHMNYVSPLQGSGDILFFPLHLSVYLSVCLSVTKSCPLYNLITVTDISMKLHPFVQHIETTCHAQEL